jgi:hypothetical protein
MRPILQEESLVDRESDSPALPRAQYSPACSEEPRPPSTCSAWTAAPAVTRSWAAYRDARKMFRLKFADENFCEVRAATKALPSEASLFALYHRYLRYTTRFETKEGECPLK